MQTDLLKKLARLGPSILIAILAIFLFQSARNSTSAVNAKIARTLTQNSELFAQQIENKKATALDSFKSLTQSPAFLAAWDQQDAMSLFLEIDSITRFLGQMGAADRIILVDAANRNVVDLSAPESRLPDTLTKTKTGADSLFQTEGGDLFQLTLIPVKGTNQNGTLRVWQQIIPEQGIPDALKGIWGSTGTQENEIETAANVALFDPLDDMQSALFERQASGDTTYLCAEHNNRIYVGNTLKSLILDVSGTQGEIVRAVEVTADIALLRATGQRCNLFGFVFLLLAVGTGVMHLRPCGTCLMYEQKNNALVIELEQLREDRDRINIELTGAQMSAAEFASQNEIFERQLADSLKMRPKLQMARQKQDEMQAEIEELEDAKMALEQKLTDTDHSHHQLIKVQQELESAQVLLAERLTQKEALEKKLDDALRYKHDLDNALIELEERTIENEALEEELAVANEFQHKYKKTLLELENAQTQLAEHLTEKEALEQKCTKTRDAQHQLAVTQLELENARSQMGEFKAEKEKFEQQQADTRALQHKLAVMQLELESAQSQLAELKTQKRENVGPEKFQQELKNTQNELQNTRTQLSQLKDEREAFDEQLNEALEMQAEVDLARQTLKARVQELEAANAEMQALAETLQFELDTQEQPHASSSDLNNAFATISELKGLLQQCASALEASQREQEESQETIQSLERKLGLTATNA